MEECIMTRFVMALDQGTTSSRCIIFDRAGTIVSSAQKEFAQIYKEDGWVEHDPMEIWESQLSVAKAAMKKINVIAEDIAAIGITNQRETTVVWDKRTGIPVYNAIVWQCRRTAGYCDELRAKGFDSNIKEKTGLVLDAYFSGTKIKWILDNVPYARTKAEEGQLIFGTIDTWLIWNLTKGKKHVTDYSNASRTMLYNIYELTWDDRILGELNILKSMLPEVKPSSYIYGYVDIEWFGGEIAISGAAGDQQAALFGQNCFETGNAKNTYGTGCFLLMNTGEKAYASKNGMLTTIAWGINDKIEYALEGSIFIAGAAVQWLRDEVRLINDAAETEAIAEAVEDTNGVYFVPAFVGLGAPYWDSYARGSMFGLTRGAKREHIIRAVLESLAYQTNDVIEAMKADSGIELTVLKVDGGASSNNFLMQFQADILGVNIDRPSIIETTALGAAYLAGLAVGYWKNKDDIVQMGIVLKSFKPDMESKKREAMLAKWHEAVKRSMNWL
jgi:glycerol kinase